MRKVMIALSIVVLALLLVPAAFAQVEVQGTGSLDARGSGVAELHGGGSIHISGSGVLTIIDLAGDAQTQVSGSGQRSERSSNGEPVLVYAGFDGSAQISGSHFVIRVHGIDITLHAEGTGWAYLKGQGTYEVNGRHGSWLPRGVHVRVGLADPPPEIVS